MKVKNEYQMFFKQKCFTHHITLPPSPLNEKNVASVLRKIEFKLNKTFLKSAFTKYKETDRFRFFIFPEDKKLDLQHFHVLLYIQPPFSHCFVWDDFNVVTTPLLKLTATVCNRRSVTDNYLKKNFLTILLGTATAHPN